MKRFLAALSPVKAGMAMRDALTAARINAIQEAIFALVRGDNVHKGAGTLKRSGPDGFSISATGSGSGGGGSSAAPHPYKVLAAEADEEENPQVKVYIGSYLRRSYRSADVLSMTGLDFPFALANEECVYLKIVFDELGEPTASVEHGELWDDYDSPVKFDSAEPNKRQTHAYLLIAYTQAVPDPNAFPERLIIGSGEEAIQVVQCVNQNLVLCANTCFEADTVSMLFPAFAPGPEPDAP